MKKSIKYTSCICRSLPGRSIKYLLVCGLLLQSCALTKTETKIVPGKELSKTSLGLREVENTNVLKEVTPYSVSISRKVCEAELFRTEYKGMRETALERQELYCATAYPEYFAFQLTTFGIPFLYDLVSGFGLFRGMCDKGPVKKSMDARETNATVTQEIIDFQNTICRDVPISGAEVTAEIDSNITRLVASTAGVAALTPELMTSLESLERDVSVTYRYMAETKKTTIKHVARPAIQVVKADHGNTAKISMKNHEASSDDNLEAAGNAAVGKITINAVAASQNAPAESQMMVKAYDQNSAVQSSKEPPGATAGEVSKFLQGAPVEAQMMVKADDNNPAVNRSKERPGATAVYQDLQRNNMSGEASKLLPSAPAEAQMMVKVEGQSVSAISSGKATIVNQEQQEVKTYMLTRDPSDPVKKELPSTPAGSETKPVYTLFKVEFAYNKAEVRKDSLGVLKMFAEAMKNNPNMVSIVEGHTDNLGGAEVNRKMSFRRASAVKDVFVNRYGIAAKRIKIYGYGLTRPIADNNHAEGRAKNRRTEIYTAESDAGL